MGVDPETTPATALLEPGRMLGVLLYEMVTGTPPFRAATVPEVYSKVLRDPPAALPDTVPAEVQAIVDRCLDKEPARRYPQAGDVVDTLRAIAAGDVSPRRQRPRPHTAPGRTGAPGQRAPGPPRSLRGVPEGPQSCTENDARRPGRCGALLRSGIPARSAYALAHVGVSKVWSLRQQMGFVAREEAAARLKAAVEKASDE